MALVPPFQLGDIPVGGGQPFVFVGGPCVIESERHATDLAVELTTIAARLQERYGFARSEAEREIGAWVRSQKNALLTQAT